MFDSRHGRLLFFMVMMVKRRAAAQASAKRERRRTGMSAANVGASNYINPKLCPWLAHIVQFSPWPTFGPHFAFFFAHIEPNAGMALACLRHTYINPTHIPTMSP